jgi:hypothetical protein
MPDLPPPPRQQEQLPQTSPDDRSEKASVAPNRPRWVWIIGAVAVVLLLAGIGLTQRGEQTVQSEEDHPLGEHLNLASPTTSPPASEPLHHTYYFIVPDVVGLPVQNAKGALREAFEKARSQDQSVALQDVFDPHVVFRVSKRETDKAEPGTVLEMGNLPRGGSGDIQADFTVPGDAESGDRVTSVIRLVVATRPIQFPGDSIYIGGSGSAMVTWLDSNFGIHQKTVLVQGISMSDPGHWAHARPAPHGEPSI